MPVRQEGSQCEVFYSLNLIIILFIYEAQFFYMDKIWIKKHGQNFACPSWNLDQEDSHCKNFDAVVVVLWYWEFLSTIGYIFCEVEFEFLCIYDFTRNKLHKDIFWMTKKNYFLSADVSGISLKTSWQKVAFLVIQNYALLSYLEQPLEHLLFLMFVHLKHKSDF